ncbi:MAG: hypothetical protein WDO74_26335 [Pseudomonadota bacterium]
MAIPTLVGILALGVGALWLTADAAWLAELTKRGLGAGRRVDGCLPAALVLPFGVGIATLSGYRAGPLRPRALASTRVNAGARSRVWMSSPDCSIAEASSSR